MKFFAFLRGPAVCATIAASAQTVPSTTPHGTGSAAPSAVPSGTPAPTANPKGAVSAGEVFTTGSPAGSKSGKRMKNKDSMSKGHDHSKMKAKAE